MRLELTAFRLWDWRAAYCATAAFSKNPTNSSQNAKTIGFGPGLLRPQSRVLTPRRSRFVFIYQLFSWVSLFKQLSQPELMSVSIDGLARLSEIWQLLVSEKCAKSRISMFDMYKFRWKQSCRALSEKHLKTLYFMWFKQRPSKWHDKVPY